MQARPRNIENKVAAALSEHFTPLGFAPVVRIPVLGRTGPDITINEVNLVVDVKSRSGISKQVFFPLTIPFSFDGMTAVRMAELPTLWGEIQPAPLDFSSKVIRDWLDHMDEWTREEQPNGISCLVLHRPEMPIGQCVVVIHSQNRRRLAEYANRKSN